MTIFFHDCEYVMIRINGSLFFMQFILSFYFLFEGLFVATCVCCLKRATFALFYFLSFILINLIM